MGGLPRLMDAARIEAALKPFAFSNAPTGVKTKDQELGTFTIDPRLPDDTAVWLYTGRAIPGYVPHLTLGDLRKC